MEDSRSSKCTQRISTFFQQIYPACHQSWGSSGCRSPASQYAVPLCPGWLSGSGQILQKEDREREKQNKKTNKQWVIGMVLSLWSQKEIYFNPRQETIFSFI